MRRVTLPTVILLLLVILAGAVLIFRDVIFPDPHWIDYDAPGVDITSEGPDDDYTEAYYRLVGDGG